MLLWSFYVVYFNRVLGQWVEDVDFSIAADGQILRVINPDPGGIPNIPYDERNTTDIPMTSELTYAIAEEENKLHFYISHECAVLCHTAYIYVRVLNFR